MYLGASMTSPTRFKWMRTDSVLQARRGKLSAAFLQDVRYGWRMLLRHRTFALAAIVTLALGIGINTAVFSVVNAIVLRPLPVRDGHRLVVIASQQTSSRTLRGVSFPDLQDYRPATVDVFEDIAGYSVGFLGLAAVGGQPERVLVTWVTGNYFSLLGVRPVLGRVIRTDEGAPGRTDPVVVLGHSTWQRQVPWRPLGRRPDGHGERHPLRDSRRGTSRFLGNIRVL